MQKIFAVVALVTILGLASAATYNTANGTWSVNPREVAAGENDTSLTNPSTELRLISSGNNVLLQGVSGDLVTERTISSKDLSASNNKTYNLTGYNAAGGAVAWDTKIIPSVWADGNGVNQINVTKYKLATAGASNQNPQIITSYTNNQTVVTLVDNSGAVHPGTNRYYVAALVKENATAPATLVVAGVDVSGTKTTLATIASNVGATTPRVSIAGIAGSQSIYVVWTQNNTNVVGAKVDPTGKVADADVRAVVTTPADQTASFYAWAAGNSYGNLAANGGKLNVQSSNGNWSLLEVTLPTGHSPANVFPKNDFLAIFTRSGDAKDLSVVYLNKNGTTNNTVSLVTGGSTINVHQQKDGSVYVSDLNRGNSLNIGQVWGNTNLSGSTLQAAVFACIAFVAALFVF